MLSCYRKFYGKDSALPFLRSKVNRPLIGLYYIPHHAETQTHAAGLSGEFGLKNLVFKIVFDADPVIGH